MKWLSIVWFAPKWARRQHAVYGLSGERTVCGEDLGIEDFDDNGKILAKYRNKNRLSQYELCKRCEKALMKKHGTLTGRVKVDV